MSLNEDVRDLGKDECNTLIRCCFDTVAEKILSELLEGNDAEAGRIIREEVEFVFADEANGKREVA